mgnify:CR=1 FL=1
MSLGERLLPEAPGGGSPGRRGSQQQQQWMRALHTPVHGEEVGDRTMMSDPTSPPDLDHMLNVRASLRHELRTKGPSAFIFKLISAMLNFREQCALNARIRKQHILVFLTSIASLVINMTAYLVEWSGPADYISTGHEVAKILSTCITVLTIALLFQYYGLLWREKRLRWQRNGYVIVSMWRSSLLWKLPLEIVVHLLFPYPYVTQLWEGNDQMVIWMVFRSYLILRVMRDYTAVYQSREYIQMRMQETSKTMVMPEMTWLTSFKMLCYSRTTELFTYLSLIFWFVFGFLVFMAERNVDGTKFQSFSDGFWFVYVTFTTIGYGDYYPVSTLGRILSIIVGIVGLGVVTLLSALLTNKLALSREELFCVDCTYQVKSRRRLENAASRLLGWYWRKYRQRTHRDNASLFQLRKRLKSVKSSRIACQNRGVQSADPILQDRMEELVEWKRSMVTQMRDLRQLLMTRLGSAESSSLVSS